MADQAALGSFLSDLLARSVEVAELTRLEGGWSRQLHRAVLDDGKVLALRGEVRSGVLNTDLEREYLIVAALQGTSVPLPPLIGFEPTGTVTGHRFMVSEWVAGESVNLWRTPAAKAFGGPDVLTGLAESWIRDIASLHAIPPDRLEAAGVDSGVTASGYVEAEVAYWTERIRSSEQHPGPLVEEACRWLERSRPLLSGAATSVVHGDLRLGNMLVNGERVAAFLDWEMAGIGDWRADIGYSLMPYNAGKLLADIEPSWNQVLDPRGFLEQYWQVTDRQVSDDDLVFFIVLGCTKMIGILCTGIDAFVSGRSSDPRLAWTSVAIPGLVHDIHALLDGGLRW